MLAPVAGGIVKVWVLVVYATATLPPHTMTVDDIASAEQCQTLGRAIVSRSQIIATGPRFTFECYPVEKARRTG